MDPFFRNSFFGICTACAALGWVFREKKTKDTSTRTNLDSSQVVDYATFRNNWLTVYYLAMAGDWIQGPYLFALYESFGIPMDGVSILFVTGFLSSAVFGTIAGSVADKIGRKHSALICCVVYSIACFIKVFRFFPVLVCSHILSGISTSLLFSVFEAWMVAEHNARGFAAAWISDTFSWAIFGNGLVAMLVGVIANQLQNFFQTYVAPFLAAICFFASASLVISSTWVENYGNREESTISTASSTTQGMKEALAIVVKDRGVLAVGGIQAFFETAMYTFVFLWTPTLEAVADHPGELLPHGIIFSSFMVSVMIGSTIFRVLRSRYRYTTRQIARPAFLLASVALLIPAWITSKATTFWAFNLFEVCCGIYFALGGTLRSKHVPEQVRATMMSLFRIPLNVMTVVSLLKAPSLASETAFAICGSLLFVCFMFALILPQEKVSQESGFAPIGQEDDPDKAY